MWGSKRMLASPAARGKVPQNRVRVDLYVRDCISMCRGAAPCAACQWAHFCHHLQQRVGHLSETAADGRSESVCGCFVVAWSRACCRPTGMPTVGLVWREAARESRSSLPHRQGDHQHFLPPWNIDPTCCHPALMGRRDSRVPMVKEKCQNNPGESLSPPVVNTPGICVCVGGVALGMFLVLLERVSSCVWH